jgi:hypothetical protein
VVEVLESVMADGRWDDRTKDDTMDGTLDDGRTAESAEMVLEVAEAF